MKYLHRLVFFFCLLTTGCSLTSDDAVGVGGSGGIAELKVCVLDEHEYAVLVGYSKAAIAHHAGCKTCATLKANEAPK